MNRKPLRLKFRRTAKKAKGQSLVEFALISVFLFFMILGIIEMGRFLFVYSVVTNAAQEGSRYGIIRPRDVVPAAVATQLAAIGTPAYLPQQVVADNECNAWDKTREKVVGVPRSDVNVSVWYDNGNGTPIVPNLRTPEPYRTDIINTGNRVVVEASYRFFFISPFLDSLAPSGIDVKMRSARTILNKGDSPAIPCAINLTPAPVPTAEPTATRTPTEPPPPNTPTSIPASSTPTTTPASTRTATSTSTPTVTGTPPTNTPTSTRTITPTVISTPSPTPTPGMLYITRVDAKKRSGNNRPLDVEVDVTNGSTPISFANVVADVYVNGVQQHDDVPLSLVTAGTYRKCQASVHRNGDTIVVDIFASAPGYTSASRLGVQAQIGGSLCP